MVAILDKVKLVIKEDRFINIKNPFGEKSQDYMCKSSYVFEKGKLYGIIGEHGSGGEAISLLLSNGIVLKQENIYIDDMEMGASDIKKYGWYVGKALYSHGFIKRELTAREALNYAIKNIGVMKK